MRRSSAVLCSFVIGLFGGLASATGRDLATRQDTPRVVLRALDDDSSTEAPLVGSFLHVEVTGIVARSTITQMFLNPSDRWVEGVYLFPLPDEAAVDSLVMTVGERRIVGRVVEEQEAESRYLEAQSEGRQASLLEEQRDDVFTATVAAIGPGQVVEIELGFHHQVRYDRGSFKLRLPLVVAERYSPLEASSSEDPPALLSAPRLGAEGRQRNAVGLVVDLDAGFPVADLASPTHSLTIEENRENRYRVELAEEITAADRDFVLEWRAEPSAEPAAVLYSQEVAGQLYGLVMVVPPNTRKKAADLLSRELILVVDTSGSMRGIKLDQARRALRTALDSLRPRDRVNIIEFDSEAKALFPASQPAYDDVIDQARQFVTGLEAEGGTEMKSALEAALEGEPGDSVRQVIFITDGQVTNEAAIYKLLTSHLAQSRLFPVAIGAAPNNAFMRRAAEYGRGAATFIDREQAVEEEMERLLELLEAPLLRDVEVHFSDPSAETWPRRVGDLYLGQPLRVLTRTSHRDVEVEVRGFLRDRPWQVSYRLPAPGGESGLHKLWAQSKVAALMDGLYGGADLEVLRKKVVDVALEHQIVTPYTSLIAVDERPTIPEGVQPQRGVVPLLQPPGSITAPEQIVVSAMRLMVDKYNVSAGSTATTNYTLPASGNVRSFYGAINLMPGVTHDTESQHLQSTRPGISGSHWADNAVFGIDVTFARHGGSRLFLPASATTTVTLRSGGIPAEHGRTVGSTIDVVTKAGTNNNLHGEGTVIHQKTGWAADYNHQPRLEQREIAAVGGDFLQRTAAERERADTGIELSAGGPLRRDLAWFFVAASDVSTVELDKTLGQDLIDTSLHTQTRLLKISLQPGSSHLFAVLGIDAPARRNVFGPEAFDRYGTMRQQLDTDLASAVWSWSMTGEHFLEAQVASQSSGDDRQLVSWQGLDLELALAEKQLDPRLPPNSTAGPHWPGNNFRSYVDIEDDDAWHNGWPPGDGLGHSDLPRNELKSALTWFAHADHELKLGLDFHELRSRSNLVHPGFYRGPFFDARSASGFRGECGILGLDPVRADLAGVQETQACLFRDYNPPDLLDQGQRRGRSKSEELGLFATDRVSLGHQWDLNLGLRLTDATISNDSGRVVLDSTRIAPRLSGVYDVRANGRMLLSLSTGRYYQSLNHEWVDRWLQDGSNGTNSFDEWLYCNAFDVAHGLCPETGYRFLLRSIRPGRPGQLADAGILNLELDPYFKDELILGFEWQFNASSAVEVKAITWELHDMIGAAVQLDADGRPFNLVANYQDWPGILRPMGQVPESVLASFEAGRKEYRALQIELRRQLAKGWSLTHNLTWGKLETTGPGSGATNTDDTYGAELHAVLTPAHIEDCRRQQTNRTVPVDCVAALGPFLGKPLSTLNRFGRDPLYDRPFLWNSYGSKIWVRDRHEWTLSGHLHFESGRAWARREDLSTAPSPDGNDPQRSVVSVLLEPTGSRRLSSHYFLNLSAAWQLRMRGSVKSGLRIEALNVTNQQRQLDVTDRGEVRRVRRDFQRPRQIRLLAEVSF